MSSGRPGADRMGDSLPEYDYYELLEVDRRASPVIIERAYKELARRYHPDNGGSPRLMQMLNEAYSVLSDPEARSAYDAGGLRGGRVSSPGSSPDSVPAEPEHQDPSDPEVASRRPSGADPSAGSRKGPQLSVEAAKALAAAKRGSPVAMVFTFIAQGLVGLSIIVMIGLFIFRGWEAGSAGFMVVLRQFALILITYVAVIEPIDWVYKNAKYKRAFPGLFVTLEFSTERTVEIIDYGARFLNARTANMVLSGWLSAAVAFVLYGSMRSAGNPWAPIVAIVIVVIGRTLLMTGIAAILEMKLARQEPDVFGMLNKVIE